MKNRSLTSFLILIFTLLFSQVLAMKGHLLLVGGGSEQIGGWSDAAYQWAVNHSANKRVAIVGYSTPTNFLKSYFVSLGAVYAKDFTVASKTEADQQLLYDSLITYSVVFFRGGDQSFYYTNYRDTKRSLAVNLIFENGGVIAGTSAGLHILSGVTYNALAESIAPEAAISNVNSTDITLANDFFDFMPGYIFDSHVAERGRFPRTVSFLARWYFDHNETIKAVAMDDLTAMGIDTTETGEVFGTGAAGIYENVSKNSIPYKKSYLNKLTADSVRVKQLVNGWKYSFKDGNIIKPSVAGILASVPADREERKSLTLLMSASGSVNTNTLLLSHLVSKVGNVSDRIIIITDVNTATGNQFATQLNQLGAAKVNVIANIASDTGLMKYVNNAYKILIVNNSYEKLMQFFTASALGKQVHERITSAGMVVAFIGPDARFAGKRVLSDNYNAKFAAYDNQISTRKGLGFLENTLIFPGALDNDFTKENAVCAVPYFLMKDTLSFGAMVSGNGFLKFEVKPDGMSYFSSYGAQPAILFTNKGNGYAFSNTTSKNNGTQQPRQVAGFDSLYLALVDSSNAFVAGHNIVYTHHTDTLPVTGIETKTTPLLIINSIYPNPAKTYLHMDAVNTSKIESLSLVNMQGETVYHSTEVNEHIPVDELPKGIYFLKIRIDGKTISNKVEIGTD